MARMFGTEVIIQRDLIAKRSKMKSEANFYKILEDVNKIKCMRCGRELRGVNKSNMRRHYRLVHNEEIQRPIKSGKVISKKTNENPFSRMDKSKFLKCCVGIVTQENISFRLFDDNDHFKVLIQPYESRFGTNLHSSEILSLIELSAERIQDTLTQRFKSKVISLRIDIVGQMGKSSFCVVTVQHIQDFKICSNTIGIIQLTKQFNSSYLKDEILKCLKSHEIKLNQIYSITSDSSIPLQKVKNILQEILEECKCSEGSKNHETQHPSSVDTFAAHAYQLAAYDVIKQLDEQINECRAWVKKLRGMAILDNTTDWSSIYETLQSLLKYKNVIEAEIDWDFIENFTCAFAPLSQCNKRLQSGENIFGDFYREWMTCELALDGLQDKSPYAKLLLTAMQKRKEILLENESFLSALYLDRRFSFSGTDFLSPNQQVKAIHHLMRTHELIKNVENDEPSAASRNEYFRLMQSINTMTSSNSGGQRNLESLKQKLFQLSANNVPVLIDANLLEAYKNTRLNGDLKRIAEVALAVPATQANFEKIFRRFNLSKLRPQLSNKNIHDFLITKLNFHEISDKNIDLSYFDM